MTSTSAVTLCSPQKSSISWVSAMPPMGDPDRAHVVVFTTSPNKKEDAFRLGADEVVVSRNANEMQKHAGSFDFIIDTVSANHDINAYINLLGVDGNLTLVGAPAEPLDVP